eukprot:124699-Pleurochrysis_carterae.AAC.1
MLGLQSLHAQVTKALAADAPSSIDAPIPRYLSLPSDSRVLDYVAHSSGDSSALVLKRDWLQKHTQTVPAVMSLWFAWGSNTSVATILSQVESMRSRCRPSCRILIVLVASSAYGQSAGSFAADDRLSMLRKASGRAVGLWLLCSETAMQPVFMCGSKD